MPGPVVVGLLAVGHKYVHGQEIVERKEGVELYGSLFLAVARPVENLLAQRHHAGIQQQHARSLDAAAEPAAVRLLSHQFLARPHVDLTRHPGIAVLVLPAQRVSGRGLDQPQVVELLADALHAQRDVAQRLAVRQVAE